MQCQRLLKFAISISIATFLLHFNEDALIYRYGRARESVCLYVTTGIRGTSIAYFATGICEVSDTRMSVKMWYELEGS